MNKVQLGAQIELARRDFFEYCHLKAPNFYKYNRKFLIELADTLQAFSSSKDDVLIINVPPRHGKSRTAGNFVEWLLGNNPKLKIMTGSYNETLSTTFSKSVRNAIMEIKADENKAVYSDIFPKVKIKHGDGAMNLWSLEGYHQNYLATSPTGTATGFGADYIIIDDLIKNALEANNATVLQGHWDWFTNTMLSRLETGGKIILIMTRWHSQDLAGRALKELPKLGYKLQHVNMKALQDDDTMLCDEILSKKEYDRKTKTMGEDIASANYQQEPIDIKGRLYSSFKTYDGELPEFKEIKNYADTADTGGDYLCSINYGVTFDNEAYVLDVLYTKAPMEETEPEHAKMLFERKVNWSDIESNNGGRGYSRSVERILKEKYNWNGTRIEAFHQSKNKQARIISNATWVMDHIYFPSDWRFKWPDYYKAMTEYQREGKNEHDDAPDATTGIAEKIGQGNLFSFD
ncbi:phage terminase large subunit [Robertmurraya siralis]|uniref:phage terminase large subunit n=1 Tax=Robertmurraya siralis TaxID=77777 RepID=UPI000BA70AE5|nr:phage terminase large subunit [Robertmurraya siralis]PAE20514.1 terminase [Bacillus sp. 7504-2]